MAIGASAGGLEAFERFFLHMPPDSGMAFVLVPHLDAHHKSAMAELVSRFTRMPVVQIADGMTIAENRVHVIQPNTTLTMRGDVFQIETPRSNTSTIDSFFRSVAEQHGEQVAGIILSGSGSDGSVGLKAVKEGGGLTLAQAGETSRYDSMPRSAIATGLVDFILPVEEMPAQLLQYAKGLTRLKQEGMASLRQEGRRHLVKIFTLLRASTGHDFSQYKNNTFIRRVHRRMQVLQVATMADYVELLRKDPQEVEALFRDLLIGVTHFFRDAKAFEVLERDVIPKLLQEKGPDDQVRVWVPGCATGEEAYSIAILLRERMSESDVSLKVQIFATDIDDHALAVARNGVYPESISRDVSPERLERYFVKDGGSYRVLKEIREMCIFSVHNVIKDAPFSKLDLISCRNLLIYLDAVLQNRVLLLFHFALRQRGYLFLGPSENITQHPKLFAKIDSRQRLFKARAVEAERPAVEFPLTTSIYRNHLDLERPLGSPQPLAKDTISRRAQRVVDSYAPACFVVDEHYEILHFSGRTGRYLQPSPGAASLNLFSIVEASLRPDLRTVIHQALASGRRTIRENVSLPVDGGFQSINLIAEPLTTGESDPKLCVLILQEVGTLKPLGAIRAEAASDVQKDEIIRHLESELIATRERLQTTIEELETSNEEMKSSNEEFQSVNEELQSANEELETSKEELQSVNEELETVNAELNSKIESLDRAISDRKNLLESTQIATLFLDNNLRVRSFTPAITEIFHLIESDFGRPITDIVTRLAYEALARDVSRVLRTLTRLEQEVALTDGSASYIMRILPYRTVDNVINGVVITFIDITERKRGEEALARLAAIIDNSQEAIIGMSPDGTITSWNAGAERVYGYAAEEAIGRPLSFLSVHHRSTELRQILDRLKQRQPVRQSVVETERLTKDGRRIFVSYTASPIRNAAGRLTAVAVVERDTTERKQAEERQQLLLAELNHRVKNTLASVLSIAGRTRQSSASLEEFNRSFEGRVQSLATAHELLAENVWSGADLRQILLRELQPYHEGKDPPVLTGGEVFLPARAALVFAMAFHELATNASKYGALSTPDGTVKVGWRVARSAAAPYLRIDWTERGGPKTEKPTHEGFGLSFVKRSVAYELHGSAELAFKPTGLQCRIEVPMTELRRDQDRTPG
ncbi:CheR family methyltransferase [Inquilinus sp. Marseille-Q2685]|uniref:CheR family methyltransferase n=1 Tax=Inquilinus sp. Marseille-Q2685 TaxID=2866581 RepID=UPI001CE47C4B|nr:CheR family methyltransferase [Inquilinus sp. Marseille-Q2685]